MPNTQNATLSSEHGTNLESIMQFPADGIFTHILAKSESFSCALICLGTGHEIDRHASSGKACIQVLRGRGELISGEEVIQLQSGMFIYLQEHRAHSIRAQQDLAFVLCLSHLISRDLYILKTGGGRRAA